MRGTVVWVLIVLSLGLAACQGRSITQNEAKAIALKHLRLVEDSSRYDIQVSRHGEDWEVLVIYLPRILGGHTIVIVSGDGKIRDVVPGR